MKMTNMNALKYVMTNCELPADVRDRVWAMYATLEKRAWAAKMRERKPSAKTLQKRAEMVALQEKVLETMTAEHREFTCSELAKMFEISAPKMAYALRTLDNVVSRYEKRVTYWSVAEEEEGE